MQCIRPIKAGFDHSGNITYSSLNFSKELATFAFPCRKCLPCRLNIGREKGIRAIHEAKQYEDNIFLTLTYNEENLKSPRLQYLDFQLFMKRLLEHVNQNIQCKENRKFIPFMVTGEYGDKTKRPHWHAILFNYRPKDAKKKYLTEQGEQTFTSKEIDDLWGNGNTEFGSVTMDSASYVARYAAKKLTHGKDQDHDFHPIHRTSSKHAIGKKWIEKHWEHTLSNGFITLPNGSISKIPRYYLDWAKKHQTEAWMHYQANVLPAVITKIEEQQQNDEKEFLKTLQEYKSGYDFPKKRLKLEEIVLQQKFKHLMEYTKL